MVCYTIPLFTGIIVYFLWKRSKTVSLWWLELLFAGASIFGVVDHLWNGELFLISGNILSDLTLGVAITFTTFAIWGFLTLSVKNNPMLAQRLGFVETDKRYKK